MAEGKAIILFLGWMFALFGLVSTSTYLLKIPINGLSDVVNSFLSIIAGMFAVGFFAVRFFKEIENYRFRRLERKEKERDFNKK